MAEHDERIFDLRAAGRTNKQIAAEIGQSPAYVQNRMAKLRRSKATPATALRGGSVPILRAIPPKAERQELTKTEMREMLAAAVRNTV